MSRARAGTLVLSLGLLVAGAWLGGRRVPGEETPRGLLGPLTALAADVEWIRFQRARLAGREALAIERAERALAIEPTRTDGWRFLVAHLALDHASPEREPELERRRRWFAAGLEAAREGVRRARRPEELELYVALILASRLELDPEVLEGDRPALRSASAAAFRRAAALLEPGDPRIEDWNGYARDVETGATER